MSRKSSMKPSKFIDKKDDSLDEQTYFNIWGMFIPSFRTALAQQRGALDNFLIATWGGLGDVICAEPAIRYALKKFKGVDISLASFNPEVFQHLNFKKVYNLKKDFHPDWSKYFVFKTIYEETHLQWEYMNHMICNSVDYVSLNMWRGQMPVSDRNIILKPTYDGKDFNPGQPWCVVHAGSHWQVKTFPKDWWDRVLLALKIKGVLPVLIGKKGAQDSSPNERTGYVDVNTEGCLDLRDQTSLDQLIGLLKKSKCVLTNDSSPIHIAASGNAWIGFVATLKHQDYLMHWRQPEDSFEQCNYNKFGWRMKNFGRGGVWDLINESPNATKTIGIDTVSDEQLRMWLPDPIEFGQWGAEKAIE